METNTLVWIKKFNWLKAEKIQNENDKNTISVKIDDEIIHIDKNLVEYRNTDENDDIDNLIKLPNLNEPSILNAIWLRYNREQIYTFTGPILIAVNPFKNIDVYKDFDINDVPHVYTVASKAYHQMIKNKNDQTIMVSGESGAGKTQSAKYILQYISQTNKTMKVTDMDNIEMHIDDYVKNIENKILESNPIIEAFGNAKTKRNDNSSRFGKLISLNFLKNGKLMSANINTYLLERVRLIKNFEGERNFHIFYLTLNGLDDKIKEQYQINNNYNYYKILKSGPEKRDDNVNDIDEYHKLINAFNVMNFNENDINDIFQIIASILHLSNINPENGDIVWEKINIISSLLGINTDELINLFTEKEIKVGDEIFKINYENQEISVVIDSFMKIIYVQLFDWIIKKINLVTNLESNIDKNNLLNIRLLDIFGFEVFDNNSFEQLCINYTNECLQQIFTQFTIKIEQNEYNKEGIRWDVIEYPDNQKCIDMFDKKNGISIFNLLEEQCIVPKGSSEGFYHKINNDMKNFDLISINSKKRIDFIFVVKHYANDVEYSTKSMVSKNKDNINPLTITLLKNSSKNIINSINTINDNSDSKKSNKVRTISSYFRNQLADLRNLILKTEPHFIRCIKPNDVNVNDLFIHNRILEQLKYNGVLSAVKIARSGYPSQIIKKDFTNRYWFLYENKFNNINEYLDSIIDKEFDYQIGKNKIFLKSYLYEKLENYRNLEITKNIITIQSSIKRNINMSKLSTLINKSKYLCNTIKTKFYSIRYNNIISSGKLICSSFQRNKVRCNYSKQLDGFYEFVKLFYSRSKNNYYINFKCKGIFLTNKITVFNRLSKIIKDEQTKELEELRRIVKLQQNNNSSMENSFYNSNDLYFDNNEENDKNFITNESKNKIINEVKQEVKIEMKNEIKNEMKEEVKDEIRNEILHKLEAEYKERAIDLIIKSKKDDIEVIDRIQTENSEMAQQINNMQALLDACLEREEHYRKSLQRRNEYAGNHNNNCNVM